MNQTAHISLQISNFQTALRQKKLRCALTSWRAPPLIPRILIRLVIRTTASPLPSAPSGAPAVRLSAAGRGGSKVSETKPQAESWEKRRGYDNLEIFNILQRLRLQYLDTRWAKGIAMGVLRSKLGAKTESETRYGSKVHIADSQP